MPASRLALKPDNSLSTVSYDSKTPFSDKGSEAQHGCDSPKITQLPAAPVKLRSWGVWGPQETPQPPWKETGNLRLAGPSS